jgi:hypothetical protein
MSARLWRIETDYFKIYTITTAQCTIKKPVLEAKSEARNPKQFRMSKIQILKTNLALQQQKNTFLRCFKTGIEKISIFCFFLLTCEQLLVNSYKIAEQP